MQVEAYNMSFASVLLWGVRRWILIPPGHDALLRLESVETAEFRLKTKVSSSEIDFFDSGPFPGLNESQNSVRASASTEKSFGSPKHLQKANRKEERESLRRQREKRVREWARLPTIELEQRPGEVLLVPSGWVYQFTHPATSSTAQLPTSRSGSSHAAHKEAAIPAEGNDGDDGAFALHLRLVTVGDYARVLREVARSQPSGSPFSKLAPPEHLARRLEKARKRMVVSF